MRCSVMSIVRSQRAIKPLISRWAVRSTPLSTCSSNPMSSRSSMVSSNWYCNLMAKSLTRWTKRSCWSKARTWSAVTLRAALCMDKVGTAVPRDRTVCKRQGGGQEMQRRTSSSRKFTDAVTKIGSSMHLTHILRQHVNSMLWGPSGSSAISSVLYSWEI